jgi:hypothetical protein
MNPIIIRIVISKLPNPRKIRLIKIFFEESETVLEHWGGVVLVEGEEECYDRFLFFWWEKRDWTSFYIITSTLAPTYFYKGKGDVYHMEQSYYPASHPQDVVHQMDSTDQEVNSSHPCLY